MQEFDDILERLLPGISASGYVDPAACRAACPRDPQLLLSILRAAEPQDLHQQQVLGHLSSIAAELLAQHREALVLDRALSYIGYQMDAAGATIRTAADAGDFLGAFLKAGTIICEGSCGDFAFQGASGGLGLIRGNAGQFCAEEIYGTARVRVLGNVGNSAGRCMRGGRLIVRGDAGAFFCRYMEGGLACARDVELLGETYGGTVQARSVRALEKGRGGIHRARLIIREDEPLPG